MDILCIFSEANILWRKFCEGQLESSNHILINRKFSWIRLVDVHFMRFVGCWDAELTGSSAKRKRHQRVLASNETMQPWTPWVPWQVCKTAILRLERELEQKSEVRWCCDAWKQLQEIVCWPCIVVVSHHKIRLRSKQTHVYPYAYDLWYLQEQARAEKEIQLEREKLAKEFQVAQKQARGEAGGDLTWLDYAWLSTAFQHVSSKRVLSLHNFEWEVLQDPAASVRGQTCSCGMTCYHPVQQNHRFVFGEAIFALL